MNQFPYNEVEIVAFADKIIAECDRALPIGRHINSNKFFKLSLDNDSMINPNVQYTEEEFKSFFKEGFLTIISPSQPIYAFPNAIIVYVTKKFIDALGQQWEKTSLQWEKLQEMKEDQEVWFACAPSSEIEALMNSWGECLMDKATDQFIEFLVQGKPTVLQQKTEDLADLALCAALKPDLRAHIYLRYASAILFSSTSERLSNIFKLCIQGEFPNLTWEIFMEELNRYIDCLKKPVDQRKNEQAAVAEYTVIDILKELKSIPDGPDRSNDCKKFIERCQDKFKKKNSINEYYKKHFKNSPSVIILEDEDYKILLCDFYFCCNYNNKKLWDDEEKRHFRLLNFIMDFRPIANWCLAESPV
jgi:hypothetical protein